MDIDEARNIAMRMSGLSGLDKVYTFYHDETNNIKKLRVVEGGLNVADPKVFVLGGVVHAGTPRLIDLSALRSEMKIQKSAPELKFDLVAKGDFLTALSSPKLTTFLRWLSESDLILQYFDLDPLFWSIVDIIDSVISARPDLSHLLPYHMRLKSDLHALLRADLAATVRLFRTFGYPGLEPSERAPFITGLLDLIEKQENAIGHVNYMVLKGVIQAGRTASSLDFIEGNSRHLLIEAFTGFYRGRLALFTNSHHVFDEESTIQADLQSTSMTSGGAPLSNHRFADSKTEPGIQLSDVAVGILGKFHSYLAATPADVVGQVRDALTGIRLENALLLRDLIDSSDGANTAFLHHIASIDDIDKANLFLRYSKRILTF